MMVGRDDSVLRTDHESSHNTWPTLQAAITSLYQKGMSAHSQFDGDKNVTSMASAGGMQDTTHVLDLQEKSHS